MGNALDCHLRELGTLRKQKLSIESTRNGTLAVKSKRLCKKDRALIASSWEEMRKKGIGHPEKMIRRTWLKASEYSPVWVWDTLAGVEKHHSERMAESNPHFNMIINAVTKFLDTIVRVHALDAQAIEDACRELGARHVRYFSTGFQPAYWDSFSVAMVEGIENALLDDSTSTDSVEREDEVWRVLYAWQKLIRIIVEHMRISYQEIASNNEAAAEEAAAE